MYPERVPPSLAMVLTDLSPGMVTTAWHNLRTADVRATFCVANAEAIPFADETFDVVIANHMLYHVPDRPRAYAEITRVLKPGGRFHATTIGEAHMRELRELLHGYSANYPSEQSTSFTLESGIDELPRYFYGVERGRYEDALEVTEVEPLIQYAASSGALTNEELARLAQDATHMISTQGGIHITKNSGIFSASKR